jgi:hypothetical protein
MNTHKEGKFKLKERTGRIRGFLLRLFDLPRGVQHIKIAKRRLCREKTLARQIACSCTMTWIVKRRIMTRRPEKKPGFFFSLLGGIITCFSLQGFDLTFRPVTTTTENDNRKDCRRVCRISNGIFNPFGCPFYLFVSVKNSLPPQPHQGSKVISTQKKGRPSKSVRNSVSHTISLKNNPRPRPGWTRFSPLCV